LLIIIDNNESFSLSIIFILIDKSVLNIYMKCLKCQSITKSGAPCKMYSSCKIGCYNLCWIHARTYNIHETGSNCNILKLFKKIESIRRPFLGLGKTHIGTSGSLSTSSSLQIFKEMYDGTNKQSFIDIGAGDGYMCMLAKAYGFSDCSGVEITSDTQLIFNTIWNKWSDYVKDVSFVKPNIIFNKDFVKLKSLNLLTKSKNKSIYTFWDGFSTPDSIKLLQIILADSSIKQVAFIKNARSDLGTFEKLKPFLKNQFTLHSSLTVKYNTYSYRATIIRRI